MILPAKTFAAGGGAYYFAKRSVNADRASRHEEELRRQRLRQSLEVEYSSRPPPPKQNPPKLHDQAGSPSTEASHDPAPAGHLGVNDDHGNIEHDRYIAKVPYRTKKGDRFS